MNASEQFEIKRQHEACIHASTREENDKRLANQHDALSRAESLALLEPFAKAYLGLFLEIDSSFSPEQRIRFIAGDALANAVIQGLTAVVTQPAVANIYDIGKKMAGAERLEVGYVVLVSMDLFLRQHQTPDEAFAKISPEMLSTALCFHYANSSEFRNVWVDNLIKYNPSLVTSTLQQFWQAQMDNGVRYLPGLGDLLKTDNGQQLVGHIILPILSGWAGYKKKTLNILLAIALRHADATKLLPVIEHILETEKALKPRMRIIWLTSAFILAPDKYWQTMVDYTYRSKEKLLPLLDFTVALLDEITLELNTLTKIIRLIAPKFPPHIDDFGALAANPQKTLRLFYEMANREKSISEQIKWLRSARVMKIVSPILDEIENLNRQKRCQSGAIDFNSFVSNMLNSGKLKERRSRFKNKF